MSLCSIPLNSCSSNMPGVYRVVVENKVHRELIHNGEQHATSDRGWSNDSRKYLPLYRVTSLDAPSFAYNHPPTDSPHTQTFTGLCVAMTSSFIWGTAALPFIFGSCAGFILGTTSWYYDALSKSMLSLDRYPSMLRLHLDANFPTRFFRRQPLSVFSSERFRTSRVLQSMLVVAWLTAQPALDVSTSICQKGIGVAIGPKLTFG